MTEEIMIKFTRKMSQTKIRLICVFQDLDIGKVNAALQEKKVLRITDKNRNSFKLSFGELN
jgi:hypothetical protein